MVYLEKEKEVELPEISDCVELAEKSDDEFEKLAEDESLRIPRTQTPGASGRAEGSGVPKIFERLDGWSNGQSDRQ